MGIAATALLGWSLLSSGEAMRAPRGIVVVPDAQMVPLPLRSARTRTDLPPAAAQGSPLARLTVLETSTADDASDGSALLKEAGGTIRRVAVGGWAEPDAALIAVTDADATFRVGNTRVTLPVVTEVPRPVGTEEQNYRVPADFTPGVARPRPITD